MSQIEEISGEGLEALLQREPRGVLVDFWSPWCAPCRTLRPHLRRLAQEHAESWRFVAVNAEEDSQTAVRHQVRALPTLVFFTGGHEAFRFAGSAPLGSIAAKLDELQASPAR